MHLNYEELVLKAKYYDVGQVHPLVLEPVLVQAGINPF